MLNEKIKTLRKANGLTQEELAEKVMVSRQAVTKWETGLGTPDVANLEALAKILGVSVDELLSEDSVKIKENVSRTEFDVFVKSDFCLNVGTANSLDVSAADIEKVVVEIRSDLPAEAYKPAKVKLTEGKKVDLIVMEYKNDKKYLDVKNDKNLSGQEAKKHVFIKMILPCALAGKIELSGNVQRLFVHDFEGDNRIEFDGKVSSVDVRNSGGHLEITSNTDMEVNYDGSMRQLDVNQIRSFTDLYLPKGAEADVYSKGRSCRVLFDGFENKPEAAAKVELNGIKSEMTVRVR